MSTVQFDTWKDSTGSREFQGATAWVNFDGTGTVSIRDSFNVDSITDNGTGSYRINFTTPFSNASYTLTGSCSAAAFFSQRGAAATVDDIGVGTRTDTGADVDPGSVHVAIHGGT